MTLHPEPVGAYPIHARDKAINGHCRSDEVLTDIFSFDNPDIVSSSSQEQPASTTAQNSRDAYSTHAHNVPRSKPPMAQHFTHIGRRLAIARNTACALDGTWTCVVCGEGQMNHPELVQHLA